MIMIMIIMIKRKTMPAHVYWELIVGQAPTKHISLGPLTWPSHLKIDRMIILIL